MDRRMETHLTVVATLAIVYRSLIVIGAAVLAALAFWFKELIGDLVEMGSIRPHEVPMMVFDLVPLILVPLALLMVLVSIAGILGAIGVLRRKEWGRILLLVVSFLNLIRIPVGTLLGGYSIWVLMHQETVRLFDAAATRQTPAP